MSSPTAGAGRRSMGMRGPVLAGALLVALAAAGSAPGHARSDYPQRPVRVLVPFQPGGATDILARLVAQQMSQAWNQTAVVDNRPGANGIIATEMTAKAVPDGHTLLYVAIGHAINALIYPKLPYDTLKDFVPISLGAKYTQLLLVHPGSQAKSVADLLAMARTGKAMSYASGGVGSSQHLAGALFNHMTKIGPTHVPYKGGAPALADLMGNNVDFLITLGTADAVRAGKVRALAVTSPRRHPSFPELATMSEAGVPGFQSEAWYGLIGPARLPAPVVSRIHEQAVAALSGADVRQRLQAQGAEVVAGSPAAFAAFIRDEIARYAPVVKAAGIVAQ